MRKLFTLLALLSSSFFLHAQIVINELDTDTDGQDFEEFVELKSDTPNASLDGYVLVFFNGSESGGDSSYMAFDLDGASTDINGILTIGSSNVSPVPEFLIEPAIIQNGADGIGLYLGDVSDFPEGTLATTTNLIDALVYDTNDADDTELMALLGVSEQINEGQGGDQTVNSIQRNNDGTYFVGLPTPGALNDGSGIDLNGVSFTTNQPDYQEGEEMIITFTTEQPVTGDLIFDITLSNETFDTDDFSGDLQVVILDGTSETAITIQLLEDGINDGDEFAEIDIQTLPAEYNRLVDNVEVLVLDIDGTTAIWGSPLNPTFGLVESTAPAGYYNSLDGLADEALRQAIQDIIADEETVVAHTYADVELMLKQADQSPSNSNDVWLLYTEQPRKKILFQDLGGSNEGLWNREHTYPRSRGGFFEIEEDQIQDGINIFVESSADSLRHGISDGHGLRATDGPENSSRGNQDYGEYDGPVGNQGSWKGDAARAVFFMAVRYNGLDVVEGNPPNTTVGELGDLSILLDWHEMDPADDFEMNRNNVIYTWQNNRNPFIDRPILVEHLWGDLQGVPYQEPLGFASVDEEEVVLYPNPNKGILNIRGIQNEATLTVFTLSGQKVLKQEILENQSIQLSLSSGVYVAVLVNDTHSIVRRLIME
ncbi:endonuclease [Flavobacteriaceae bacterium TK19130]|nr:endonuclease [Thermobacterium salinum]